MNKKIAILDYGPVVVIFAYLHNTYFEKFVNKLSSIRLINKSFKYVLMLYLVCTFFRPVNQFIYFQF